MRTIFNGKPEHRAPAEVDVDDVKEQAFRTVGKRGENGIEFGGINGAKGWFLME
jgi:hypothetical protein